MLGLGILYTPVAAQAIHRLPLWGQFRPGACPAGRCSPVYVAWVWIKPRVIGRDNWRVTLTRRSAVRCLQIAIGIVDLSCCALAMYMLVPHLDPGEPHLGFVSIAVIFVAATLLGFASHAPGGLGVFDATMMIALWEFDKEKLIAGLLLFRLLYYVHAIRAFIALFSESAKFMPSGAPRAPVRAPRSSRARVRRRSIPMSVIRERNRST